MFSAVGYLRVWENFFECTTSNGDLLWSECGARGDLLFRPLRVGGIPVRCSVPLEGRDKLEQSLTQEIKLAARSRPYVARVWVVRAFMTMRDIVSVGDSDTLGENSPGPLQNTWQKSNGKKDRSLCKTALLITPDFCLGRQRPHHIHGRWRYGTRCYTKHTMLHQWLKALKLLDTVGLWPQSYKGVGLRPYSLRDHRRRRRGRFSSCKDSLAGLVDYVIQILITKGNTQLNYWKLLKYHSTYALMETTIR